MYRLREIAAEHPAAKELVPPPADMNTYRRFAEDFVEAPAGKGPRHLAGQRLRRQGR